MGADAVELERLPRKKASEVKNKWRDLVRDVRTFGSVAVTNHDTIEMVVVEARRYQEMAAAVDAAKARNKVALAELSADFDKRLAALKTPEARDRIEAVMAAKGRLKRRPKAGASF
jgi:rRNA processing protein Krr1/Pno1